MTVQQRGPNEFDYLVYPRRRMEKELIFPWRAYHEGQAGCNFAGVFYTEAEAKHADSTHTCGMGWERLGGVSIAERYWLELDLAVDQLKELQAADPVTGGAEYTKQLFKLQGRATGLAFAVMVSCGPYYADEKAVSVEANRRWKMRNGQMDWEPTPGFKYNPPIPGKAAVRAISTQDIEGPRPSRAGGAPTTPEAQAKKLKPADADSIKRGMAAGMFTAEQLAKVYGTTVAVVNWLHENSV